MKAVRSCKVRVCLQPWGKKLCPKETLHLDNVVCAVTAWCLLCGTSQIILPVVANMVIWSESFPFTVSFQGCYECSAHEAAAWNLFVCTLLNVIEY